jgi:hypothetical protein
MEQDSTIHNQIIVVRCEERKCDICGIDIAIKEVSLWEEGKEHCKECMYVEGYSKSKDIICTV